MKQLQKKIHDRNQDNMSPFENSASNNRRNDNYSLQLGSRLGTAEFRQESQEHKNLTERNYRGNDQLSEIGGAQRISIEAKEMRAKRTQLQVMTEEQKTEGLGVLKKLINEEKQKCRLKSSNLIKSPKYKPILPSQAHFLMRNSIVNPDLDHSG